jgi:hypothetical protein
MFWPIVIFVAGVAGVVLYMQRKPTPEPGSLSVVFEAQHVYVVTILASRALLPEEFQVIRLAVEANGGSDVKFSNDKRRVTFKRAPLPTTIEIVGGEPFVTVPVPGAGQVSFTVESLTDVTP